MNTRSLVSRIKKANKNRLLEIFGGAEKSVRLSDEHFPKALEVFEVLIKRLKADKIEVIVSHEGQIYLGYQEEYIQLDLVETFEHECSKGEGDEYDKYGVVALAAEQVRQRFILKLTALRKNNSSQSFELEFFELSEEECASFIADKFYRYAKHATTFVSARLPMNEVGKEPIKVEYALIKLIAFLLGNDSTCAQALRTYKFYFDTVLLVDGSLQFEEEVKTRYLKKLNKKEMGLLKRYLG